MKHHHCNHHDAARPLTDNEPRQRHEHRHDTTTTTSFPIHEDVLIAIDENQRGLLALDGNNFHVAMNHFQASFNYIRRLSSLPVSAMVGRGSCATTPAAAPSSSPSSEDDDQHHDIDTMQHGHDDQQQRRINPRKEEEDHQGICCGNDDQTSRHRKEQGSRDDVVAAPISFGAAQAFSSGTTIRAEERIPGRHLCAHQHHDEQAGAQKSLASTTTAPLPQSAMSCGPTLGRCSALVSASSTEEMPRQGARNSTTSGSTPAAPIPRGHFSSSSSRSSSLPLPSGHPPSFPHFGRRQDTCNVDGFLVLRRGIRIDSILADVIALVDSIVVNDHELGSSPAAAGWEHSQQEFHHDHDGNGYHEADLVSHLSTASMAIMFNMGLCFHLKAAYLSSRPNSDNARTECSKQARSLYVHGAMLAERMWCQLVQQQQPRPLLATCIAIRLAFHNNMLQSIMNATGQTPRKEVAKLIHAFTVVDKFLKRKSSSSASQSSAISHGSSSAASNNASGDSTFTQHGDQHEPAFLRWFCRVARKNIRFTVGHHMKQPAAAA